MLHLKINGWITNEFKIFRGIRQGCPVSALLFILCTEIMAINVRENNTIEGIKVEAHSGNMREIKISQYADDGTLVLKNGNTTLNALETISKFSEVAGPKLNTSKTEGLWIGTLKHCEDKPFNINWQTVIRYLGIYIGHDKNKCHQMNWISKLEKLQKILDNWRKRYTTIFGRVTIIKSLALPKIIFSATMLPIPDGIVKEINKIIFQFLWDGQEKIKRSTLIGANNQGGLSMIDIESQLTALKAAWIPRMIKNENSLYTVFGLKYLYSFGKEVILNTNFTKIAQF